MQPGRQHLEQDETERGRRREDGGDPDERRKHESGGSQDLDGERMRFTELLQRIPGISQRMLTRTVRHLERDGLLTRTVHPEVPPRVEYELTATGRTLIEPAVKLAEWAVDHNPDIERSQASYDVKHP